MVIANNTIKKCGNCGRFFVRRPGYNNEYCNRTIQGTNKTCKDIGALKRYRKINIDKYQKLYEKHYKKIYAFYSRNKEVSDKSFTIWGEQTSNIKNEARVTNMTLEEFENKLEEIENAVMYQK